MPKYEKRKTTNFTDKATLKLILGNAENSTLSLISLETTS